MHVMGAVGVSEELELETRALREEADAELGAFYEVTDLDGYRRFLTRAYGFIAPLERSLLDTAGLERFIDRRRFSKRLLLVADLETLGLKALEIDSIPQCMWIPWFDDPHTALGWAYVVERNMNATPNLFRHLAAVAPGEAAFAASYLKAYTGGQMWQSFLDCLAKASPAAEQRELLISGAKAGYRFFRRWRNTLDGRATSGMQAVPDPEVEPPVAAGAVPPPKTRPREDDSETS